MRDGAARVSAPAVGAALAQPGTSSDAGKLKVFISYSRKDEDFAQELLTGLQLVGFEPYLDKHDIAAGEDWEQRLGLLIEAADTVVFVISPDAMASNRCAWEVNRTVELKKRLLPIVFRRVEEAQVPPRLKQLNYIFFDRPFSFAPSLQALATALRTDVEWIREHTRIGVLALRWDSRGRVEALLLRGEELAVAKTWIAAQPQYAPEPTLLHHEFIKAGENAEVARASAERKRLDDMAATQAERQRALDDAQTALKREAEAQAAQARARRIIWWVSAVAAVLLVLGVSGFAYQQYDFARQQSLNLVKQKELAEEAKKQAQIALAQTRLAEENFRKGQITESHYRAEQAKLVGEDHVSAMLLALEGLPDKAGDVERPFVSEPWDMLYRAHLKQRERAVLAGHTGNVHSAAFSADGRRILTASWDNTARLWDAEGKPLVTLAGHTGWVNSALFSADGRRIVTASSDKTARLWDGDGKLLASLEGHMGSVRSAVFSADGRRILTQSDDKTARLWDAEGKPLVTLAGHMGSVNSALFSADGQRILTASSDKTARLWDGEGKLLASLEGHTGPVWNAVFSADGRRILTASDDKTARLWDGDGKPLATLEDHTGPVGGPFSPPMAGAS